MQIINGDCLSELSKLPENTIDLTVTSPPYDNLRTYNGNNALWGEHVWKGVIKELFRVTKQGGVVVWVVGDATIKGSETGTSFKQALWAKDCGFNLHDTMIYAKNGTGACGSNLCYWQAFEYMFVFSKGTPKSVHRIETDKPTTQGGTRRKKDGTMKVETRKVGRFQKLNNIWKFNFDKNEHGHPAVFPCKLAHDHIISWSNAGDTVLDPFMGSGTTGKIAKKLGREFIGIELDSGYCKIAEARINAA